MERPGKCEKRRLRMLILLPDGRIHRLTLPFLRISFREAPLTATLLAALTPPELGLDIRCEDREYALALCRASKPLRKKWGAQGRVGRVDARGPDAYMLAL